MLLSMEQIERNRDLSGFPVMVNWLWKKLKVKMARSDRWAALAHLKARLILIGPAPRAGNLHLMSPMSYQDCILDLVKRVCRVARCASIQSMTSR
jgi:hypothetical protein